MKVTYLPPYVPTDEEASNPTLYATNVRHTMAKALNRIPTDLSDRDAM